MKYFSIPLENSSGTLFFVFFLRVMLKNHNKKGYCRIHDCKNFFCSLKYIEIFRYDLGKLSDMIFKVLFQTITTKNRGFKKFVCPQKQKIIEIHSNDLRKLLDTGLIIFQIGAHFKIMHYAPKHCLGA